MSIDHPNTKCKGNWTFKPTNRDQELRTITRSMLVRLADLQTEDKPKTVRVVVCRANTMPKTSKSSACFLAVVVEAVLSRFKLLMLDL